MSNFERHPIVAAHLGLHYSGDRLENDGPMYRKMAEELCEKLQKYEEQEALNVANQIKGTYVLHMPVQYMVENAKPKDVTVYNLLKEQLTKINQGETAAMILPALTDENGNRMFTLEYVGPQKI